MKKTMVLLVALLLIGSIPCNAIFKRKVVTSKIYSGKIKKVTISPDKKRMLIINDQDEMVLYDIGGERVIVRYSMVTDKYVIYAHSVSWGKNNKISLTKHTLNTKGKVVTPIRYETKDLIEFTELFQYNEVWERRLSNLGKVSVVQNINTNEIRVRYKNKKEWNTGLGFEITGFHWSNNDRFVFVNHKKDSYLLDTLEQKSKKLDKYFSGKWAPTKNLYCFFTGHESMGFEEKGLYLFNAEDISYVKLNTRIWSLRNLSRTWSPTFIWSPDSRYIVIPDVEKMYLLDASLPQKKPQVLVQFDEQIDENRVIWSKDLKHILFSYETRTINPLKPFNFYAARVNINTGKMQKLYIDGLLYKGFFWIDDHTIIYQIDHMDGLYKSELKW